MYIITLLIGTYMSVTATDINGISEVSGPSKSNFVQP